MLFPSCFSSGMEVKVTLFSGQQISEITLNHLSGKYLVTCDGQEVTSLAQDETITLQVNDSFIQMVEKGEVRAAGSSFLLTGIGFSNSFALMANDLPVRIYDDNLEIQLGSGNLKCINIIDLEKYVSGVIQAEAGGSTDLTEYFKVQALVSRTYALKLIRKYGPGYCLTDDVTNQAYKGKPVKPAILEAVKATEGKVIVSDDSNLINAVFHSNSGGYTLASDEVWISALPYLQPIKDTFSIGRKNYSWTQTMPVVEWLNYLDKTYGYPLFDDSMKFMALNYTQQERTKMFLYDIPLTRIRNDLKLKSTYFSISQEHDKIVFTGKGYGHGVGLSQEGAIRMAELGYSANDIVTFYYTGVQVKSIEDLALLASLK